MSFITTGQTWSQVVHQGHGKQTPVVIPANIAPSLESALPRTSISCSHCQRPAVPATSGSFHPSLGRIMWLPHLKRMDPSSVIHHPAAGVNEGAGNHPCLAAMASDCGCLAFCMPVTSFSGSGIVDKYARARNPEEHYERYLPLDEQHTPWTHSKGMLVYDGDRMRQQSYVHLEMGYWIEWANLTTKSNSRLTRQSLETAKHAYAAAEMMNQANGCSRSRARLARSRSPTSPPRSHTSGRSVSPPTPTFLPPRPQGLPQTPPPSPPLFVLAPRGNAAVPIKKSLSQEKLEVLKGSWR